MITPIRLVTIIELRTNSLQIPFYSTADWGRLEAKRGLRVVISAKRVAEPVNLSRASAVCVAVVVVKRIHVCGVIQRL